MNKRMGLFLSGILGILLLSSVYFLYIEDVEAGEVNYTRVTPQDYDVNEKEVSQGKYVEVLGYLVRNYDNRGCDIVGLRDNDGNMFRFFIKGGACGGNYFTAYQYKITGQLGWSILDNEYILNIYPHTLERYSGQ